MAKIAFLNRSMYMMEGIAAKLKKQGHQTVLLKHSYTRVDRTAFDDIVYLPKLAKQAKEYAMSDGELLNLGILQFEYQKKIKNKSIRPKQLHIIKKHMTVIKEYLQTKSVEVILLYNGSTIIEKITEKVSNELGLRTVYIEEGFFRPFTISIDPQGVNANSSLPRCKEAYEHVQIDEALFEDYLRKPMFVNLADRKLESIGSKIVKKMTYGTLNKFKEILGEQIKTDYMVTAGYIVHKIAKSLNAKFMSKQMIQLPEKFIFAPLQVHSDSQILLHSPNVANMDEFINLLVQAVTEFNKRFDDNYSLVIKQHPQDYKRYKSYNNNVDKCNTLILDNYDIDELIKKSELVITINSTVAIEALSMGKKVISLGEAFFNIEGVVNYCNDVQQLHQCINNIIGIENDFTLVKKFLYYLRFNHNIEGFLNSKDQITTALVADSVLELLTEKK